MIDVFTPCETGSFGNLGELVNFFLLLLLLFSCALFSVLEEDQ